MDEETRRVLVTRLATGEIDTAEYDRILARVAPMPPEDEFPDSAAARGRSAAAERSGGADTATSSDGRRRRNYLVRLWRGELSLPTTYWLWGILASIPVTAVATALISAAEESDASGKVALALSGLAVLLAWMAFIYPSIWRSATRYSATHPGKRWGGVVKVVLCLGALSTMAQIGQSLTADAPTASIDAAVARANADTPKMVEDHVRLDRFERVDRSIVAQYTVLGDTQKPSEDALLKLTDSVRADVCANAEARKVLASVDHMERRYFNEQHQPLMTISIAEQSCR